MDLRNIERRVVVGSRFLTIPAVLGSLAGAILMFVQGLYNIYEAYRHWLVPHQASVGNVRPGSASVISVIEGLDRFLIAIVLLYFAYGVYSLFIHPEQQETELALPAWLQVKQIGQLKQVVAEVIIVVLFVLFLRVALQTYQAVDAPMSWLQLAIILLLPVCTALLALSLRFVELHPKPVRERNPAVTGTDDTDAVSRKENLAAPQSNKSVSRVRSSGVDRN
jgi:uncharacterized membrane protein YqhA